MLTLEKLEVRQGEFSLFADLALSPGKITGLIGPSGAGKSTLLAAIAGFVDLVEGRVLWQETPLNALPPGQRPVAILFQDNNLFPHMSVVQNVALGAGTHRPDAATRASIADVLARVGLTGLEARKPGQLSGGQQSRAALARVLVQGKPLWLLDEPFAALGPALKSEMLALVAETARQEGASVLMVTHDPQDARQIADQVIVLAEGRAAPPVGTQALFEDPPQALRDYLGK